MNLRKLKFKIADRVLYNEEYILNNYVERCAMGDLSKIKRLKLLGDLHRENRMIKKVYKGKHYPGFYPECKKEQMDVEQLVCEANKYDVISFDIFDTLVLRACEKPSDVFFLLEKEWGIMGFSDARIAVELELRKTKQEITIEEIYEELEKRFAINKIDGIKKELAVETAMCYANPYMFDVVTKLAKIGKKIIAVSDMYIPKTEMKALLLSCGYSQIEEVFVSCDYDKNKGSGELQKYAMSQIGSNYTYMHIGDNILADVQGSKGMGWSAIHYKNVQNLGKKYRITDMKSSGGRIYKGLVNAKLHAENKELTPLYEFGYAYGGPLVIGYLQYLKKQVDKSGIDQLLFVARDGDILYQCSKIMDLNVDCEYIPFSRFASYHVAGERYMEEYMKNCIASRIPYEQKISQALSEIDAECMLPFLGEVDLQENEILTEKRCKKIFELIRMHKKDMITSWAASKQAAETYFKNIIGEHKHVCIVDIGWAGTSFFTLREFLNDVLSNVKVSGALLAGRDNHIVRGATEDEVLNLFLFGPNKNEESMREFFITVDNIGIFNACVLEVLFSADQPSFLMFQQEKNGEVGYKYARPENNGDMIEKMQEGMRDFVRDYQNVEVRYGKTLTLAETDAYKPIERILKDRKYVHQLIGDFRMNTRTGIFEEESIIQFKESVKYR